MSKIKYIILFAVVLSLHSCCSSQQFSENPSLENTEWILLSIGTFLESEINAHTIYVTDTATEKKTYIIFKDGSFNGKSYCNNYSGTYTSSENSISFKQTVMTEKGCEQQKFEQRYISILNDTVRYEIENGILTLYKSKPWSVSKDSIRARFKPLYP